MNQRPRQTTARRNPASEQEYPERPEHTSVAPRGGAAESDSEDLMMQVEGVYIISVAARILDMHPQTLRKYERLGLIRPGRTLGMLRLYSREDIRKVKLIRHLSDVMGLNLAGVEFALATVDNLMTLRERLARRVDDASALQAVEEELDLLFASLNLPLDR